MNATVFEDWVKNKLIPALTEPTCVVMDNAPYHSRECPDTKSPTMKTLKEDMKTWLRSNGIEFNEGLLKPEIYTIIKQHKPKKEYVVDRMLQAHGHMVLRLPAYYCDLNPIELIWAFIKNQVARENTTFKLNDVKQLTDKAFNDVTASTIKNSVEHVKKVEKKYWDNDGLSISPTVGDFNINIDYSSDSDSCEDLSSEDSD